MKMSSPTPYHFFIFDLGRVLLDFDFSLAQRVLEKHHGVPADRMRIVLEDVQLLHDWDRGVMTSRQFYQKLCRAFGLDLPMPEMRTIWNEIFTEKKEMIQLARRILRKKNAVILSNINPWHADYIRQQYAWVLEFKEFITSCDLNMRKPDPEIYRWAMKKHGAKPEHTLYFDDIAEFVQSARQVGIDGILFKDHARLAAELKKRGLEDFLS